MAKKDSVNQFFEKVYNDKGLQGSLHAALCKAAPDVVVEIAKKKGHEFTAKDLEATVFGGEKGEMADKDLANVSGGLANFSRLASFSLASKFWGNTLGGFGRFASGFELTIPGPTFVKVQTPEGHEGSVVEDQASPVSAVDLYEELA